MNGTSVEKVNSAWVRLRDTLEPNVNRLNWMAFRELAEGRTPTVADIAQRLGLPMREAERAVQEATRRGLLTLDGERITGSRGLTTEATRYRLLLGGRRMYVWCALDAVGIPAALGWDTVIEATLMDGTGLVVVELRSGNLATYSPTDLRIGLPSPTLEGSVRDTLCPRIGFHLAAKAPRHPEISILTLEEAAELGRTIWSAPKAA